MTLGFSDGSRFDNVTSFYLGDQSNSSYHNELSGVIDRDHHVPLVASAIMNDEGKMTGLAIDHRIPANSEYEPFLALHERSELPHMKNLIDAGMDPTEAYHEAHDKIATPTETAAVRAHAARLGQDPDQYLDKYKQFWRDAAAVASQPSDRPRHPRAHTTVYGLDEGEGVYRVAEAGDNDNQPKLLTGQPALPEAGTPEGELHDQSFRQAITNVLGGGATSLARSKPFLKPANDNEASGETKAGRDSIVKANPGLVKYVKEKEAQRKRSRFHIVPKTKSAIEQLQEERKGKSILDQPFGTE